ncbi:NUDIX domain-containing protein [Tissierella sp. Yu-01]|nr:NUDIX domain-containing protein [Tissierella sp. Yu-01]WFA10484.1 NUDIX domain-containing protein [Tissierella sp. Yu-01]WFA10486.1 NUDIX domain-containing protein [Tissierella sp. Yu-01]
MPGGHREVDETILDTAKRELQEETGAIEFEIQPISVYSVTGKNRVNSNGNETFGMLFYAEIHSFKDMLEDEIEKIEFFSDLPSNLTYPEIQPYLYNKVVGIKGKK